MKRAPLALFSLFSLCMCLLPACAVNDLPAPSATSTVPFEQPDNGLILHNADWQPAIQAFHGVDMVLVPAGCFTMGIHPGDTGDSDELPASRQCFDKPFWIDKTEVTNAQFDAFQGAARLKSNWTEPNRPRTNLRWTEALAFCQLRGTRLPTEREWEYAARGPDDLIYPWGNDWQPDDLVFPDNANQQTADVGSRPAGASWVGALDMAGNVWEWTSTLYDGFTYPYSTDDKRDDLSNRTGQRVVRGGSWYDASDYYARASNRGRLGANIQDFSIGVRCAKDY